MQSATAKTTTGYGPVRMAHPLCLVNNLIWIGIGVATVVRMEGPAGPVASTLRWIPADERPAG